MSNVVIKCPQTGKTIPTGIAMDKVSFESATLTNNSFGPCPACGRRHTWDKRDAWVQG
jgi:endogenous inhibitor of DNA gyrase (YacG/DUF329 family)